MAGESEIMSKSHARILILSELLSFPTINQKDWDSGLFNEAKTGDLVSLSAAPSTKWYLSWVREVDKDNGDPRYLLESIDDGELCWWSNVSLNIYSRERVKDRPMWQWDDKQSDFFKRWLKVGKRNDAYIVLPDLPVFGENNKVTLNVRIRFKLSAFSNPKTFDNWKKLTMREMGYYYQESEKAYKAFKDTKSA